MIDVAIHRLQANAAEPDNVSGRRD